MKKKIAILLGIVILVGISFILWNNRTIATITLDINPSIEIHLTKNEKVTKVIALNEDAKAIISNKTKEKSLAKIFEEITNHFLSQNTMEENEIVIILHSEGNIENEKVASILKNSFGNKQVEANIIIIESITKEDRKLAKKYKVSPAKVSYVKSILDNNNATLENLITKSVNEIQEVKQVGKYCEKEYTQRGDWCYKEKERVPANPGKVCPTGYLDYQGICYEETAALEGDNYICRDLFKLIEDKCVREETKEAIGNCDSGDFEDGYCVIKEIVGEAEEYCRLTPATDILIDHKCYGPKPIINGGCLNGDRLINGGCVDMNSYYESDYRCKTGDLENDKCYRIVKTKPTSYSCEDNAKLNGTKCEIKEIEDAQKERLCPTNYTLVNNERCINYNKTVAKENGFVCEGDNTRLEGNTCILYEIMEAKKMK